MNEQVKPDTEVSSDKLEDQLLKQMIVLTLAHDFMSPFRTLIIALDEVREAFVRKGGEWSSYTDELSEVILETDALLLTLSNLYNDVREYMSRPYEALIAFMKTKTEGPIEVVVSRVRILLKPIQSFNESIEWQSLAADTKTLLNKITNMFAMLDTLSRLDPEESRAGRVNLRKTAEDILAITRRSGANIKEDIDGQATVVGNSAQIQSICANLVGNAVKYGFQGQPVRLQISISSIAQPRLISVATVIKNKAERDRLPYLEPYESFLASAHQNTRWVQLLIRDYGIGIPEKRTWGIFKPFKQLGQGDYKDKSLPRRANIRATSALGGAHYGFGLSVSQFFARLHGGELVADSKEGGPTTFALWLPLGHDGDVKTNGYRPSPQLWWDLVLEHFQHNDQKGNSWLQR